MKLLRRRRREPVPEPACPCGNHPLTDEDVAEGGRCLCCRAGHIFLHDIDVCLRCRCPRHIAFPA